MFNNQENVKIFMIINLEIYKENVGQEDIFLYTNEKVILKFQNKNQKDLEDLKYPKDDFDLA